MEIKPKYRDENYETLKDLFATFGCGSLAGPGGFFPRALTDPEINTVASSLADKVDATWTPL